MEKMDGPLSFTLREGTVLSLNRRLPTIAALRYRAAL
jgi:hypothetical protein